MAAASAREIQVTRKLCRPDSRANMFGECADTYRGTVTEKEYTAAGYIAVVAGAAAGYFLGRRLRFGGWEEVPHPANSRKSVERVRGNANRLVLTPIVDAQPGPWRESRNDPGNECSLWPRTALTSRWAPGTEPRRTMTAGLSNSGSRATDFGGRFPARSAICRPDALPGSQGMLRRRKPM